MRTKATNLSLSNDTKAKAAALRERRQYKSVTALVEELIRDEFERRFPNGLPPAAPPVSSAPDNSGTPDAFAKKTVAGVKRQFVKDQAKGSSSASSTAPATVSTV